MADTLLFDRAAAVVMMLIGRTRGHAAHKATPEPVPTDCRGPQGWTPCGAAPPRQP